MRHFHILMLLCLLTGCGATSSQSGTQTAQDAWSTVRTINRHWALTEDMDSLALHLHEDMVVVSPDGMLRGKRQIIDAYHTYADYAQTLQMEETEPVIQLYHDGKTAVVTYRNNLKIQTTDNRIESFSCRDMYTLVREAGEWRAVAQHYSFLKPD